MIQGTQKPARDKKGREVGEGFKREGTCVYLMLIDVGAWQKAITIL